MMSVLFDFDVGFFYETYIHLTNRQSLETVLFIMIFVLILISRDHRAADHIHIYTCDEINVCKYLGFQLQMKRSESYGE